MKYRVVYLISVVILSLFIWFLAVTYGVTVVEVDCPPVAMDCGDGVAFSPFFFLPTLLVQPGYYAPALHEILQPTAFFALSLGYWFLLANLVVFAVYKAITIFKFKK
jgi:hypothetical protein